MIQSLEEVMDFQRFSATTPQQTRARQTLLDLSKEFGLLCSLTTSDFPVQVLSLGDPSFSTAGRAA